MQLQRWVTLGWLMLTAIKEVWQLTFCCVPFQNNNQRFERDQIVDVHTAERSLTENATLFSKGEQTRAKHGLTWIRDWQTFNRMISECPASEISRELNQHLWDPASSKPACQSWNLWQDCYSETMCIQWQRMEMNNPVPQGPQNLDTWAMEKSNTGWWVIFSLLLNLGFQIQLEKDKGFFSSAMSVTNWQIWWWRGSLCIMVHWKTFSITANFCQNLLVSFTIHKEMASNRYFNNLTTCFIYKVYKSLMVLKSTHV